MHLGTVRTALYNYLAAKASGGLFTLRIDDTDTERNSEADVKLIYETMDWLGLGFDITFRQSQRGDAYGKAIQGLLTSNIAIVLDNGAIALRWSDDYPIMWKDELTGEKEVSPTQIDQINGDVKDHEGAGLVLSRGGDKYGQPTYQFATVVDDYDTGINYIIRGVDHISNTPKQLAIWYALNHTHMFHTVPHFAHVGLLRQDKKKLSKRDNAASMELYRDAGYTPRAILNWLLRMGWGGKEVDDKALYTLEEMSQIFLTHGRMKASDANMDIMKLDWFNKMSMKRAA